MTKYLWAYAGSAVVFLLGDLIWLGFVVFAVTPGLREGSWKIALLMGGLFGLFAYGTYDLTNLATLRNWSVGVSILDMAWGIVISALASTGGYVLSVYMEP